MNNECLQNAGATLADILISMNNNGDLILSRSYSKIIIDFTENNRFGDLFIFSRFMYRIGEPVIYDKAYDTLEHHFKKLGTMTSYTSRTYDDDPVPYELLQSLNLANIVPKFGSISKYAKELDQEKTNSIRAVTEYEDAYEFAMNNSNHRLILSLKVDGVNAKSLYINNNYELSLSRARTGMALDYTNGMMHIIPLHLNNRELTNGVKIYSETFTALEALQYFRDKYDKSKYKTAKSSAIIMLRTQHDPNDYRFLNTLAFDAEGLENVNSKSETLKRLNELGFNTVPFIVLEPNSIPKDYNEFCKWLRTISAMFKRKTSNIPSDGLVLEIDSYDVTEEVKNQYSDRNIALKLADWDFDEYTGIVEEILLEQKKVDKSCRVKIKPHITKDGCTATYISVYSARILIANGINIGTEVVFSRDSGAINKLVRRDSLK